MGENASKIGQKLEEFGGNYLLTNLGWQELLRDVEIKCSRTTHKNPKGNSKRTHGIDLLCKFSDPYSDNGQAVLIECKNRQMVSITSGAVNDWVKEIINNIECAQSASELQNSGIDTSTLATGLLLIHANDIYDENEINVILSHITTISRRNPINIFIATNREINAWTSLFQEIDKTFFGGEFSFVYPSISESSKVLSKHIPINTLFSRFIFAQYKYKEEYNVGNISGTKEKTASIIFSFDEITIDSFRYLWSMFKHFQMEGTDEYIFYFYPRKNDDTQLLTVNNFINAIEQDGMGISDTTKKKIQLRIIDNRSLSPIETMKG